MATSRLGKQISQILEKKTIKKISTIINRVKPFTAYKLVYSALCAKTHNVDFIDRLVCALPAEK